jgi:hypothetical protein
MQEALSSGAGQRDGGGTEQRGVEYVVHDGWGRPRLTRAAAR